MPKRFGSRALDWIDSCRSRTNCDQDSAYGLADAGAKAAYYANKYHCVYRKPKPRT
jgi:hypothetical protein